MPQSTRHRTGKVSIKGAQRMYILCTIACTTTVYWFNLARVTIHMLPNTALLEIFQFYMDDLAARMDGTWYTLVHVCQRWRGIALGSPDSPNRLNLQLYCTHSTPVMKTLKVWPPLPIAIRIYDLAISDINNILVAIDHNDRICELTLCRVLTSQLKKVVRAMEIPFPGLKSLKLEPSEDDTMLEVPTSFLGGSAPILQSLCFYHISFPELPKLLLTATCLVHLELAGIPHSGYISPEAMADCLSALTRLEDLHIGFEDLYLKFEPTRSHPVQKSQHLPPHTRTLPNLTKLQFRGTNEYLEDLVARIEAPVLDNLGIMVFRQLTFDTPQLAKFIRRTPKFKANDESRVVHFNQNISVTIPQTFDGNVNLTVL